MPTLAETKQSPAAGVLASICTRLSARVRKAEYPLNMPMGDWGRAFFPSYFEHDDSPMHTEMDATLQAAAAERRKRIALVAPRGFAKSTRTTFLYPLWCVCNGLERYILLLSDTYSQAVKYLKAIRHELEFNEDLAEVYPEACGRGPTWNNEGITTRNGVELEPLGAGQRIRGRRDKDKRPTLIVLDDPEGDDAAYSPRERETLRDWATKGVFKAGSPESNIVLAGTLIHRDCLLGHCSRLPGWDVKTWRALPSMPHRLDLWLRWEAILRERENSHAEDDACIYYEENRDAMHEGAEVLWPERFPLRDLMYTRATEGHTAFLSEMQNKPVDPSLCEWDPDLLEGEDLYFDDWPEDPQCVVVALDPSKGRTDRPSDYQAVVGLAVSQEGDLYFDADLGRRTIDGMMNSFVLMSRDLQPDVAVCEADQFQELLLPALEELAAAHKLLCPVQGIKTGNVPKPTRIRRMGPYICRGRIRIRRNSAGADLLRQQWQDFPNGDHDDGPDAAEMALRRASQLLAEASVRHDAENPY